ncbi:MAG: penicillin-binding protein 2 [Chloroflexota bacterium]
MSGPEPRLGSAGPARSRGRVIAFCVAIALVTGVLGFRLFDLQVLQADRYTSLSRTQRMATEPIRVPRGLIYDRRGRKLVENVPTFTVRLRPADLPYTERERVAARLAQLLDLPPDRIIQILDRARGSMYDPIRIATDVPTQTARLIAEEHASLPGVRVDLESRRNYLFGPLVSHVLGWTGRISGEEFGRLRDDGYLADDTVGKAGLELTFEEELRGRYGLQEVQRDSAGRTVRPLRTIRDAEAGQSLVLTIDLQIQKEAERALKWAMNVVGLRRGVFLVMNPQTGEVLAMVSLPSYDNNLFSRGISTDDFRRLVNDRDRPLINLAISEQEPPGSTYKLITGAGALADKRITPQTRLMTQPFLQIGRWKYWEWNKEGWGLCDMNCGFGHSSDTYFYQVAGRLGIDRLAYWAQEFGFGRRTGIDLPGEVPGIVPTNAWARRLFGRDIYSGEVYQAGIGQGFNMITALQLLNAYAALANGGTLYRPQLVRRIVDADGRVVRDFEPDVIREIAIDPDVLRTMRVASRNVLVIRHTYNLVDLPIVVAGKSGTAEFGIRDAKGRLPFHSWVVGFTPRAPRRDGSDPYGFEAVKAEDSQLVFLAFAFDSRTRGNAATEIVKYFLQLHYDLKVDLRETWILQRDNFYGQ